MATVMAIMIGLQMARIMTRHTVPGRERIERRWSALLMTPWLRRVASGVNRRPRAPKSGFANKLWKGAGGGAGPRRHLHQFGIAWVMAAVKGPSLSS